MKYYFLLGFLWCSSLLFAQEVVIKVTNPAPFDRPLETIEIPWVDVQNALHPASPDLVGVLINNQLMVSQTLDLDNNGTPEFLLFQFSFKKEETRYFSLIKLETQDTPEPCALAMFMVPREDVAWENDRIAYRIYGSARAGDVRSGLDVLVKRVRYPVLEKWYHADSLKGTGRISYHVDHGEGADFFTVGKSLGGGGCALWMNDSLIQSGLFTSHQIIANGPIRAMFTVSYEHDTLNGVPFVEEKTYTLDAGENLNKIDVHYTGLPDEKAMTVAIGLVKRKNVTFSSDEKEGWFSLWGLANDDSANGDLSTGVVIPGTSYRGAKTTADHYLMLSALSPDKRLTYYAGGGWSRGGFASEQEWQAYLAAFAQRVRYPLNISYTLNNNK